MENLVTTGKVEGSRAEAYHQSTDRLKIITELQVIQIMRDREKWKSIVANVEKCGT